MRIGAGGGILLLTSYFADFLGTRRNQTELKRDDNIQAEVDK
jgi:hypothetical protein